MVLGILVKNRTCPVRCVPCVHTEDHILFHGYVHDSYSVVLIGEFLTSEMGEYVFVMCLTRLSDVVLVIGLAAAATRARWDRKKPRRTYLSISLQSPLIWPPLENMKEKKNWP